VGNLVNSALDYITQLKIFKLPVINKIKSMVVNGESTIVTWDTDKKSSSVVGYGVTNVNESGATDQVVNSDKNNFTTSHTVLVNGLVPATKYLFITSFTDNAGNVAYVDIKDSQTTGSQGVKDLTLEHKIKLINLRQGTTFAVTISVQDEQGTLSTLQAPDFTTSKDENPPIIENVKTDSALTQSDIVQTIISWKTNEQSSTSIFYSEGHSGQEKELNISDNLTTNHVGVITIFKPGTVYSFKVKSVDAAGNERISSDFVLLTPAKRANVIQIIIGNFGDIFSWAKIN
jgi:hypothetical protein